MAKDGARVAILDTDPLEAASDYAKRTDELTINYVREVNETRAVKSIRKLQEDHDIVFVDTAGIDSKTTDYAVQLSDLVLVPVKAAAPDVKGLIQSKNVIESVSIVAGREIPGIAVLSDVDARTRITEHMTHIIEETGFPMLRNRMMHRTGFRELLTEGGTLRGAALKVAGAILGELQMMEALDYYKRKAA